MSGDPGSEAAIEVRGLHHVYEGGIEALRGVDLRIDRGEVLGVVGQNGSGKTTLVRHFNGILRPTSGDVLVFGQNTHDLDTSVIARNVGYVFQNPDYQLFLPTVEEELLYGPTNIGMDELEKTKSVEWVIARLGLQDWRERHPFQLTKLNRKILSIACVLAMKPQIIIFDEPTTGQDKLHVQTIMSLVRELTETGHTLVMVTHDMSLVAEYCTRVVVLSTGLLVQQGTPSQVFSDRDLLSSAGLHPPEITSIAQEAGLGSGILTTVEALTQIKGRLGSSLSAPLAR